MRRVRRGLCGGRDLRAVRVCADVPNLLRRVHRCVLRFGAGPRAPRLVPGVLSGALWLAGGREWRSGGELDRLREDLPHAARALVGDGRRARAPLRSRWHERRGHLRQLVRELLPDGHDHLPGRRSDLRGVRGLHDRLRRAAGRRRDRRQVGDSAVPHLPPRRRSGVGQHGDALPPRAPSRPTTPAWTSGTFTPHSGAARSRAGCYPPRAPTEVPTMLHVHRSNTTAALVDVLAKLVAEPRKNPAQPERVIVPSPGMETWLQQALAREHGVCANMRFVYPLRYLPELVATLVATNRNESVHGRPAARSWSASAAGERSPALADPQGAEGQTPRAGVRAGRGLRRHRRESRGRRAPALPAQRPRRARLRALPLLPARVGAELAARAGRTPLAGDRVARRLRCAEGGRPRSRRPRRRQRASSSSWTPSRGCRR